MIVSLVRELKSDCLGIRVLHDDNKGWYIVNPDRFPVSSDINYFFTLDTGVMSDLILYGSFKELTGGEELDMSSYASMRAQIDSSIGKYIPNISIVAFKRMYESIKKAMGASHSDLVEAEINIIDAIYAGRASAEELIKLIDDEKGSCSAQQLYAAVSSKWNEL